MTRFRFEFGPSLERRPGEVADLAKKVEQGKLTAELVKVQPDGDIRYWGVDVQESPVLQRLKEYGVAQYQRVVGRPPVRSFVMVNHIAAGRSPGGSGGTWHRDSLRMQYKAFVYLTDVERESLGPFCVLPGSNGVLVRAASALGWALQGRGNHNQPLWLMRLLWALGARKQPVLAKAGVPFFANTSLIHRGLDITEGQRIAATVYLYGEGDAPFLIDGRPMM